MMHRTRFLLAILTIGLALGLATAGWAGGGGDDDDESCETLPFDDLSFFFELNDTDGDLGVQLLLGAEPWKKLKIFGPDGRKLLDVSARGDLRDFGLSSLHFESNEPSFDEMTMEEILELFPEGDYEFVGRTIDNCRIEGIATLTHDIPDAPEITSPSDGDEVADADLTISWDAVTTPAGIDITSYEVIVTNDDDPTFVFDVHVPPTVTSITVPGAFLEGGTTYELEILAKEEGGNQTISVIFFSTE